MKRLVDLLDTGLFWRGERESDEGKRGKNERFYASNFILCLLEFMCKNTLKIL